MKVLLVEDDPSLREGMSELIADLAEVRSAGTVNSALTALHSERFDLVLTDLRIAGAERGGRTILEAARRHLEPVAIVSAATQEDVERALSPFAPDAVLTKPFQLEDMMALVERFLALRRDVDLLSRERPPEADWSEASPGIEVARTGAYPEHPPAWLRMDPGASYCWQVHHASKGVLLVEGDLETRGEQYTGRQYLYLSPGPPYELRTREGCLAVGLTLRG